MNNLKDKFFEMIGVKPGEVFGLYNEFDGNFVGNYYINDLVHLRKEHIDDLSDSCISVIAIIRGDVKIGPPVTR